MAAVSSQRAKKQFSVTRKSVSVAPSGPQVFGRTDSDEFAPKKPGMCCGWLSRCAWPTRMWRKQKKSVAPSSVFRTSFSMGHSPGERAMSIHFCEHTWDVHRILANFPNSHIDARHPAKSGGLSAPRAQILLQQNGLNELPKPKEMGNLELFLRQFWNLLWVLLIGASTLSLLQFFMDMNEIVNLYITLIIYAMIVVMCTVSWYQEMNARRVVMGFQKLLPKHCVVVRDGKEQLTVAQKLVVGDIIRVKNGCRIPADCRILHCNQLKLEASSITGESEAMDYQAEEVPPNVNVFEARNVALNGSLCVDGEGTAIVIKTGKDTAIGQIADLTMSQGLKKSRLEEQIRKYVMFLLVMALTVASIVFVIGGFVHQWRNVVSLLSNGFLVCCIGMVPCGLPATVTSMLSLIAKRLANKKVYLKRLDICEALGQVGIIASDKTGTLTKNQMTVTGLWCHDHIIKGRLDMKADSSDEAAAKCSAPVSHMLECMAVGIGAQPPPPKTPTSPKSTLHRASTPQAQTAIDMENAFQFPTITQQDTFRSRTISRIEQRMTEKKDTGTPSEMAMARYADNYVDVGTLPEVVFEVPFNSRRKWHLIILRVSDAAQEQQSGGECEYRVLLKGASEILAKKCSKILTEDGHERDFGAEEMDAFENAYHSFADGGLRVIGFAMKAFRAPYDVEFSLEKENFPIDQLIFLGTCGIQDEPREESAEAIRQCREAGIKVFMVTGDHQLTATAIARQIGLIADEPSTTATNGNGLERTNKMRRSQTTSNISGLNYEVIHGERISKLSEQEWDVILAKQSVVFARTTPEQKLLIVEQCQKRRQLIAMTGDGVNDAPALKKADIGIAMGSGSEVAKQASDIILMDDNFSSIVRAVKEGRVMYENIKKLLAYTMPHSFPEVWPIIINFCFGMPQGITALQILTIDLGTELLPGVSMAKEPAERDVMQRPPRAMDKVLVSNNLLSYSYLYTGQFQSLGCLLAYLCVFWSHGISVHDLWMSELNHWHKGGDVFHSNGNSFSVDQQLYIARQACSAWQMGIVFGQFFNIWSARTRRVSLFRHGFFSNKALLVALVVELALINAYVYMPGLNEFLGGAPIPWECWAVVAAVGLFTVGYNEVRKLLIRRCPHNRVVHFFKW